MQKGFSLIEVIIVVALVGVLATGALPRIADTLANQELQTAAVNLAADIRSMQQLAMNANGDNSPLYTLRFSRDEHGSYYIIHNGRHAIKTVYLSRFVQVTGEPDYIMFSNKGAPRRGQKIELKSIRHRYFLYIYIAGATGRVRVSANGNTDEKDY
ncbi:type II secretion system protein [Sporomusa acidovorans]|uniref:Prepilin-type N-terminal cleavage/methylation domain-containing protein n=1 Tax=Sporomusa acidovorans (strain ATCC 49682 / DSM 3132 / Mol) TaxID=1123286 RepID=A0ABZ3J1S4_SPOA4|nr:type II secretion system protein [Sporomusa acidovorans]OZC15023.1 hypothetical protein SPACI_51380 [Sporomusa acidovorans DSM 3132]SDE84234.1 prepilin-type N-terminal cleavage/methylation domain-containing protein [Sporomusa acidovorans]